MSTSRTPFKGFLLQAHDENAQPIGYFEVPEGSATSKTLNCPNNQTTVKK